MDSSKKALTRFINVFGSHTMRVEPDLVSLRFSVSWNEKQAKVALVKARDLSTNVQAYLGKAKINGVGVSQVNLRQHYKSGFSSGRSSADGYTATFSFHVILKDLSRLEDILIGVIDAGANNIQSVNFQTTKLKDFRVQARQQVIHAAREKALIYCEAANTELGKVLKIDDRNPDRLQNNQRYQGHTPLPAASESAYLDGEEPVQAVNPASIVVSAAVKVVFEIK